MIFFRLILLPLSFVYYCIISVRLFLFKIGFLKTEKFTVPVISVGNITTGGTGKTPLVIYLTDYLISEGKNVGVISRGYKRKSNDLIIAYNGKSVTSDIHSTGDELSMIVNRFSYSDKFFAVVYHDRVKAINVMVNNFSPDIIILDDAFQNRRISRSLDIVIRDKENSNFLNNLLLPAGNLRETNSSLKRADIIIDNYKFAVPEPPVKNASRYIMSGMFDDNGNDVKLNSQKKAVIFSGIANNKSFQNVVSGNNIDIFRKYEFSDHYNYSSIDIELFKAGFDDDVVYLTTEKDFIKIREFKDFILNYPVYYLRIDVILINCSLENLLSEKNII